MESRAGRTGAGFLALLLSGCAIATPYRSVGDAPGRGRPGPASTVVVAATHARVHPEGRALFDAEVARVVESLPRQPGLLGYSLRRHLWRDEVWTMTVWKDDASRQEFVGSSAHRNATAAAGATLARVRYVHFEMPVASAPPAWSEVLARLPGAE